MTPANTAQVFQEAVELGLKLDIEPGETLTVQPANRCAVEFANTLREHKAQLLALLRLPFRMEYSWVLKETLFFAYDDDTRAALVEAGADPWSIYTKEELRVLVAQNRIAPLSPAELRKVHEIQRAFSGRIT